MSSRVKHPHQSDSLHPREHTFPGHHTLQRHKPRRLPLVLRVTKGSVHVSIVLPVFLHSVFTALVVWVDVYRNVGLPGSVIPSLSIVVGLMLVFRNGTAYDRFWAGRNHLSGIIASVRNLARTFLVCSRSLQTDEATEEELLDTETVVRLLIALLYSIKHHLRLEFAPDTSNASGSPLGTVANGSATPVLAAQSNHTCEEAVAASIPALSRSSMTLPISQPTRSKLEASEALYADLLKSTTIQSLETRGVSLPYQLSLPIEAYIRRGVQREWWIAPQAAHLQNTLSLLLADFAKMETIRNTPIPVAILIHTRQVLALYLMALPFAIVDEMAWWSIAVIALTSFTLYGIEGIGRQISEPFGYDKNDIKIDSIMLDAQEEIETLVEEWKAGGGSFN